MELMIRLLTNILEEGLAYGIMALGVYITYSVLHFPDLSVDGTFPLGACVTAALIQRGVHPVLALGCAFTAGCAAGGVTGFLHVKVGISDLLSGILSMTALWSINLVALGGRAVAPFYDRPTLFNGAIARLLPTAISSYRVLLVLLGMALLVKLLLDVYGKTLSGLLLRAAGDNEHFVSAQGVHPGRMKMLGLMLGNGLTAFSGSVVAQQAESASVSSGTGTVVMGLAAVIIGTSLLGQLRHLRPTTRVLLGMILYKAALVVAMRLGLPTNYIKLMMALLFALALSARHPALHRLGRLSGRWGKGRKGILGAFHPTSAK